MPSLMIRVTPSPFWPTHYQHVLLVLFTKFTAALYDVSTVDNAADYNKLLSYRKFKKVKLDSCHFIGMQCSMYNGQV